ncbi:hypothetical protein ncot_08815 [Nocardioides sp. JQ2195]|uniref:hypothetical protein n=1 Tax=Nocardioides sp. JQ2195 TaxID=2592334 RepID=UPI00143ECDC7|nr:hypothetical protein [Nocardioides sp. JQ2195]QIX26695.1 hypothetical protein ncot_08815 [Nocardioides sp. JQ2195]
MSFPPLTHVDPFDLPEWLGTTEVTWQLDSQSESPAHHLAGRLVSSEGGLDCDLLAVDQAFPTPVAGSADRTLVHQAWRNGQVVLAEYDDRLALVVPGTGFTADRILATLGRLAKAVGARPEQFVAALRVGAIADHG